MYSQTTLVRRGNDAKRLQIRKARTHMLVYDHSLGPNKLKTYQWIGRATERRKENKTDQFGMERHPDSLWKVLWSYKTMRPR